MQIGLIWLKHVVCEIFGDEYILWFIFVYIIFFYENGVSICYILQKLHDLVNRFSFVFG